jgi:excisionase family DNA binding protein
MRNSPVIEVNPDSLDETDRARLNAETVVAEQTGTIDLSKLPLEVAKQLLSALKALARGESVAAVTSGKALTTTEAAQLLGMSRTHLIQLCDEGSVDSYLNGTQRRIPSDEVQRILVERNNSRSTGRLAAETAAQRRLTRAIRAVDLQDN